MGRLTIERGERIIQRTVGMKVIRIQIQSLQKGTNCPFLLASTLYLGRKGQILKGKLHLCILQKLLFSGF